MHEFFIRDPDNPTDKEMQRAVDEMGPAQIREFHRADGAPPERLTQEWLAKFIREMKPRDLLAGSYSCDTPGGRETVLLAAIAEGLECTECNGQQTSGVLVTPSWVGFECNARCKILFWVKRGSAHGRTLLESIQKLNPGKFRLPGQ